MKNIFVTTDSSFENLEKFFDYLDKLYAKRGKFKKFDKSKTLMVTVSDGDYGVDRANLMIERGFSKSDRFAQRMIFFETGETSLNVEDYPEVTIEFV